MVTLAHLEKVAQELSSSPAPTLLAQAPAAPSLEQHSLLLSTKLSPPRLPISLVERDRLLRELDAARWYETQGEWREAIAHALASSLKVHKKPLAR